MTGLTPGQRRYSVVERTWPATVPALTEKEAVAAAKRLWRKEMGTPFKGKVKITSGNRNNWVRRGTLSLNPSRGWKHLVHDLSHYFHWRMRPKERPHSSHHTMMEARMTDCVVNSGWLDGKLRRPEKPKAEKAKPDPLAKIEARIKAWETKKKRAETYLRKLAAQKKRIERAHLKLAA